VVLTVTLGAAMLMPALAGAHIEPDPSRVEPGAAATVAFLVEHGCDESPTIRLKFKIPKGVTDVEPQAKDGWTTRARAKTVVFEGGPLGPDTEDSFAIAFTAPDRETLLVWKVIQKCQEGLIRWIDTSEGAEESPPVVGVGQDPPEAH
jgi:uncharacterized protein YcnI